MRKNKGFILKNIFINIYNESFIHFISKRPVQKFFYILEAFYNNLIHENWLIRDRYWLKHISFLKLYCHFCYLIIFIADICSQTYICIGFTVLFGKASLDSFLILSVLPKQFIPKINYLFIYFSGNVPVIFKYDVFFDIYWIY